MRIMQQMIVLWLSIGLRMLLIRMWLTIPIAGRIAITSALIFCWKGTTTVPKRNPTTGFAIFCKRGFANLFFTIFYKVKSEPDSVWPSSSRNAMGLTALTHS